MYSLTTLRAFMVVVFAAAPAFASGGAIADPADGWDELWNHTLMDLCLMGGIFTIAAVYMLFKYRAKSATAIGTGPKLSTAQMLGWALIPAFIFMADDFYLAANGWTLWNTYRNVPAGALEVKVTAQMWAWNFEYENGVNSDVLKVPVGRPVVLRMMSDDVVHSFYLPKYRVKEDVMPGRVTYLWFNPKEVGKTYVTCTEFCGANHANMNQDVAVIPQEEFTAWLESSKAATAAAPPAATQQPAAEQPPANGQKL